MKRRAVLSLLLLSACVWSTGCASHSRSSGARTGLAGHLLLIGGGLDDDNKPVYGRLIELARAQARGGTPSIVIATAASGDQDANSQGKTESIQAYCPECHIRVIRRETPGEETVQIIDAAHAMFFTGGDQKRITTRYRPDGIDTPEASAMRRLLTRGGTIAGTSAGDAMMSDPMFLTGRSAEALGIRSTRTREGADDDADARGAIPLGPQIGGGMGFLPWAIADSHFFERHRFGRLVAACETSGKRLGIGVGEDACVEVDLSTGELVGVSVADSLLVDVGELQRDGLTRRNIRALVISQGTRIGLVRQLTADVAGAPSKPSSYEQIPVVEPGQNRQLASWRFFVRAANPAGTNSQQLKLDGYDQIGWSDGRGWSVVEITPQ